MAQDFSTYSNLPVTLFTRVWIHYDDPAISQVLLGQRKKLGSLCSVGLEIAEHCGGDCFLACNGDAAGFHAHVTASDDHADRFGLEVLKQGLSNLLGKPFLYL